LPSNSDITGTSELLIAYFNIIAPATALFTRTHTHYTYIHNHAFICSHTHDTPAIAVSGIS